MMAAILFIYFFLEAILSHSVSYHEASQSLTAVFHSNQAILQIHLFKIKIV